MAKKNSTDIELKEISAAYPSLQDENDGPEEQKNITNLQARSQVRNLPAPPLAGPANSNVTPVVPVTTRPPDVSFMEQQRLRNSAQVPNNLGQQSNFTNTSPPNVSNNLGQQNNYRNTAPPNLYNQHYPQAMPMGYSLVQCSGCRGMIQYPNNVSIVCCTACRATTATKPLINIVCHFCKHSAYYPAEHRQVRCRCGTFYAINPA